MNNSSGHWDRREFLRGAALAGTAGLVGLRSDRALAEPPPETKRIRLLNRPTLCEAPQYVAEELHQGEGFRDIQYIKKGIGREEDALASGEADITMLFGPRWAFVSMPATRSFSWPGPHRLRRDLRERARADHPRPERQDVRDRGLSGCNLRIDRDHGRSRRSQSRNGHHLGHPPIRRLAAAAGGGEGRRLPGLSTARAGGAGEEDRSRDPQHAERVPATSVLDPKPGNVSSRERRKPLATPAICRWVPQG